MEKMECFGEGEPLDGDMWYDAIRCHEPPSEVAERVLKQYLRPWTYPILSQICSGWKALELGSGTGELSATLAREGRQVALLDWSADLLGFAQGVFRTCGQEGGFVRADVLDGLPFADNSFDCVWSSGVLEHFTQPEICRILSESARVSRHLVLSLVPNAWSLPYRVGKWHQQRTGQWRWGREVPERSLVSAFRKAGLNQIQEETVAPEHASNFLTMYGTRRIRTVWAFLCRRTPRLMTKMLRQGYLLMTVGYTSK